ncbi:hypothetical protein CE91St41_06710 [Oscillospiraceae bacterium]|nr:hypothetical protein CE91St40_06710 [Oscillospiraceae bacterium]BDF73782.1 hypothetical protein CE91St41_06710 [Oscillospiraceae bacterium]
MMKHFLVGAELCLMLFCTAPAAPAQPGWSGAIDGGFLAPCPDTYTDEGFRVEAPEDWPAGTMQIIGIGGEESVKIGTVTEFPIR